MSSQFDPYRKWLGIESEQRPPNHYELLGIEEFEDSDEVINAASIKCVDRIQDIASGGQHPELSQQLLNEIAAARVCLMDPALRRKYELSMTRLSAATIPVSDVPAKPEPKSKPTAGPGSAPAAPAAVKPVSVSNDSKKKKPAASSGRKKKKAPLILHVLSLVTLAGVVILAYTAFRMANGPSNASNQSSQKDGINDVKDFFDKQKAEINSNNSAASRISKPAGNKRAGKKPSGNKPAANKPPAKKTPVKKSPSEKGSATKQESSARSQKQISIASYIAKRRRGGDSNSARPPESQGWAANEKLKPVNNKPATSPNPAWTIEGSHEIGPHYTKRLTPEDYARMWEDGWSIMIIAKPTKGTYVFGWANSSDDEYFKPTFGARVMIQSGNGGCIVRSKWKSPKHLIKVSKKQLENRFLRIVLKGDPKSETFTTAVSFVDANNKNGKMFKSYTDNLSGFDEATGTVAWIPGSQAPSSILVRQFRMTTPNKAEK